MQQLMIRARMICCLILLSMLWGGCQPFPTPTGSISPSAPEPTLVETPALLSTPSPSAHSLRVSPGLPPSILESIHLPPGWELTSSPQHAEITLTVSALHPLSQWIYVLAAPFPTVADQLSFQSLLDLWTDGSIPEDGPTTLLVSPETLTLLEALWGKPSPGVKIIPSGELLQSAWDQQTAWAILPFEELQPRWKVIAVDGQNPLHKDFRPDQYPLTVSLGFEGDSALIGELQRCCGAASDQPLLPPTNRPTSKMATVVLTGVTALVRGTAALMGQFGMDYPARDILPWLQQADILHISNEVAFAENCPNPNNWQGLAFCSQPRTIQLLEDIGTDVIDLAGDHFADWDKPAMLYTLQLYHQRGWQVYGGGENESLAQRPALFEVNGNRIAFLGCNAKEKAYATAGPDSPGAIHCDWNWLEPAILDVKAKGYLPIITFQHQEYYEYKARPALQEDFRRAARAGAVIVSGSQAHQPQAMEFAGDAFLHYGLGNLFFDQVYSQQGTDQAFIDRYVFFDGRLISIEILTIRFVDYARSRPMTPAERASLLQTIFAASGWVRDSQVK